MTVEELIKVTDDDIHYKFVSSPSAIEIHLSRDEYKKKGIGYFFPSPELCKVLLIKHDSDMEGIPNWLEVLFTIDYEGDK